MSQAQATFCATLADELIARGVRHAVVAPGSRSTPMLLALAARSELTVHVVHDERAAGFVALGLGLAGTPAIVLCTSGTAAANLHPAVVEAGLSGVPMLVVTADRPAELRDVGAPQTIDQTNLYGRAVRWFHDPGIADEAAASTWRSLGRRLVDAARDGPVHLNLPFREPLVAEPGALPPRRPVVLERRGRRARCARRPRRRCSGTAAVSCSPVAALRRDATSRSSRPRVGRSSPTRRRGCVTLDGAVVAFDALLRHEPDGVRAAPGRDRPRRPARRVQGARRVGRRVGRNARAGRRAGPIDPDHTAVAGLEPAGARSARADASPGVGDSAWRRRWIDADEAAEAAIDAVLGPEAPLSRAAVARLVARALPDDAELVVASSMPVRDLEWFGGRPARAHANRGANGIDGVVSTALGVALRRGADGRARRRHRLSSTTPAR